MSGAVSGTAHRSTVQLTQAPPANHFSNSGTAGAGFGCTVSGFTQALAGSVATSGGLTSICSSMTPLTYRCRPRRLMNRRRLQIDVCKHNADCILVTSDTSSVAMNIFSHIFLFGPAAQRRSVSARVSQTSRQLILEVFARCPALLERQLQACDRLNLHKQLNPEAAAIVLSQASRSFAMMALARILPPCVGIPLNSNPTALLLLDLEYRSTQLDCQIMDLSNFSV